MQISEPCVVALSWTVLDGDGATLDALPEPVEFLIGGTDLLPKIEEALLGHATGYEVRLHLEPEHAFGEYDAELVCFESRDLFQHAVEPGMQIEGLPPGALSANMPADAIYTVTEVYPSHVVLDANHPLAGMALNLRIKVCEVRPASEAEIEAGSAGGESLRVLSAAPASRRWH